MKDFQHIPPQPVRKAKQGRSRILTQSVREATLQLIDELGADAVTTAKIAERVGIGPASLYRYYPNKEAIFTDIFHSELAKLDQHFIDNSAEDATGGSLESIIRARLESTRHFYARLISLHRGFFIAYYQHFDFTQRQNPETQQSWREVGCQWWASVLRQNRHRLQIDDIDATSIFLMDLSTGFFHRKIEIDPSALQDAAIVGQLETTILRYLLTD